MRKAYREYIYNGWEIRASEYYNDWELQPTFDYGNDEEKATKQWENFCNNEEVRFKTLKEAKAWTKTPEADKLKVKYL